MSQCNLKKTDDTSRIFLRAFLLNPHQVAISPFSYLTHLLTGRNNAIHGTIKILCLVKYFKMDKVVWIHRKFILLVVTTVNRQKWSRRTGDNQKRMGNQRRFMKSHCGPVDDDRRKAKQRVNRNLALQFYLAKFLNDQLHQQLTINKGSVVFNLFKTLTFVSLQGRSCYRKSI